jgi:regulator of sirC expression with transglutaminase-like and TPR domain
MMRDAADFAAALRRGDATPEQLALAIARIGDPALRADDCLEQLDGLARELALCLDGVPPGEARARALLLGMTQTLGFDGNHDHYYEAGNSYLNVVLERRKGLPILLSVVLMALGARLRLQIDGMGFPGHFLARYQDEAGTWFLDAFYGEVVAPQDVADYLGRILRRPIRLGSEAFAPVTPVAMAQRILNNLRNLYLEAGDYGPAGSVLDYMLAITPGSIYLWRERGVIGFRTGELQAARRALRRYFFLTGRTQLLLPERNDEQAVSVMASEQQLVQMLQEIDETLNRLN